jgi:hypothetical protein
MGRWTLSFECRTPGFASSHVIRDEHGTIIGEFFVGQNKNAELAAAAPELLRLLLMANNHIGGMDDLHHEINELIEKLGGSDE